MAEGGFSVQEYLQDVRGRSKVLSDESVLLARAREGDKPARQMLITSYLALAAEIALRLAPARLEQLEAIQEANLVLMRVVSAGESPALTLSGRIAEHFETLA
jgi:DNA-directed RNA polymerase sigma subunit (sigma70/sigma32)